jgi:hypothetical protein
LTVRELIKEQRRRLGSVNPVERLAAALLIPAALAKQLNRLADHQIGQLLLDEVWSRLSPLGPESTICLHAVDRLRGSPEGESSGRPACPRCGSEMLIHYGVDQPDFFECVVLDCGHREPA